MGCARDETAPLQTVQTWALLYYYGVEDDAVG